MIQKKTPKLCLIVLLLLFAVLLTPGIKAQSFSEESLAQGLPNKIANEWKAITPSRKLPAEKIIEATDAKILAEYGLQSVTNRSYTNGKDKLAVEAFEMKYVSGSYGLWTFRRQALQNNQREYFNGRYLIHILAPSAEIAEKVMSELQKVPASVVEIPLLPTYLPDQHKIPASEKYIVGNEAVSQISAISDLKEAIDFTGGTHAAVAEYSNGSGKMSVILVEFQSPQFATDGLARIQQHFSSLPLEEQKKRILRRVGNYAVEAVNVSDPKAAEELLGQIKYMARVYWEGKGISDIPLQFRPPDPVSIREAVQTGQFIVAAFYWIGMLVLGAVLTGVFAGGAFFYWRRLQRRKLGLDETFSDAGGMTRLNLDDYLLGEANSSQKLLGKNE